LKFPVDFRINLTDLIKVDFFLINETQPTGLVLTGHAGLEKKGADILCAAVSVLSENLGESLQQLLKVDAQVKKDDGFYSVKIKSDQVSRQTELLFSSVLLGMQVLQKQYPERIYINFIKE
jgi:uncharacterized protein